MVIKFGKRAILLIALSLFFVFSLFYISFKGDEASVALPVADRIVVIDAGHGGIDGGAESKSGLLEKDINLKIAKYLESFLKQGGAKVIMTRTKDVALYENENNSIKNKKREDLIKRREIANSSGADMMISIHLNKFEQSKYKGAQVFYESNFAESHTLAKVMQKTLIENLDKENKRQEMKIDSSKLQFKELSVPSILVECGFLSNPEEALLLADDNYQQKVAFSIYLGILNYYNA